MVIDCLGKGRSWMSLTTTWMCRVSGKIINTCELSYNTFFYIIFMYHRSINFIGVRGMPAPDIESLGVMGKGAGGGQEILPPPPPSSLSPSPSESGCLVIIAFLRFLTHMRDLDAMLPGNCSQFRCGSFLFSKK